MSDLKQRIIDCLKAQGADLVGFGSAGRFADTIVPQVMPECKTVICAIFRVLRGSHRGIEDGTTYYQYTMMGVKNTEENTMPLALIRTCSLLDDLGYAALPQRKNPTVTVSETGTNPEIDYEDVTRGRNTELALNFDEVAVKCGLGELGLHGGLLTDAYGPLVRMCAILTDAEIEESPIAKKHLCDGCGKCLKACPGSAIDPEKGIDEWQCATYYQGANMHKNPFLPFDAFIDDPDRLAIIVGKLKLTPERAREVIAQITYYPPAGNGYTSSICGRACHRACYVHLEETGKLTKNFEHRLRRQPEWELPLL